VIGEKRRSRHSQESRSSVEIVRRHMAGCQVAIQPLATAQLRQPISTAILKYFSARRLSRHDRRTVTFFQQENAMVLCPVALAVGCKGCPIFNVCPVKGVIGDYRPEEAAKDKPASGGKKKK
jgi:hypothetical protein